MSEDADEVEVTAGCTGVQAARDGLDVDTSYLHTFNLVTDL